MYAANRAGEKQVKTPVVVVVEFGKAEGGRQRCGRKDVAGDVLQCEISDETIHAQTTGQDDFHYAVAVEVGHTTVLADVGCECGGFQQWARAQRARRQDFKGSMVTTCAVVAVEEENVWTRPVFE